MKVSTTNKLTDLTPGPIAKTKSARDIHPSLFALFGVVAASAVSVAGFLGILDITHIYLRQDASVPMVALVVLAGVLASLFIDRSRMRELWPLIALVIWSGISLIWSVVPAATARASMWTALYFGAFLVALVWPRISMIVVAISLSAMLGMGLDLLIVTESSFLTGVWFNKNVQGSHLLLLGTLLFAWIVPGKRVSPYVALVLGIVLFSASLTRSAAAQILLAGGVLFLSFQACTGPHRKQFRKASLPILAMALTGLLLAYMTIRPPAVQIFGVGLGTVEGVSLDKTNTSGSLGHRVEMIAYGLKAALDSKLLGLGAGTAREVYPGLKEQPGLNVADIHNYYVELFMTVGLPGLGLFLVVVFRAIAASYAERNWALLTAIVLFSGYLAFDVPGYFPTIMLAYFSLLGAGSSSRVTSIGKVRRRTHIARFYVLPVAMGIGLTLGWAWWTAPCNVEECTIGRRIAAQDIVVANIGDLEAPEQIAMTEAAIDLHPKSYWPLMLNAKALADAGEVGSAYAVYAHLAEQFPYATLAIYGEWHTLALLKGDANQASIARRLALDRYGKDLVYDTTF